ncbi:CG11248 [Drosophila busckii]|uniref:CG11248 n=1 Tax=Drosophila busckii TaxID=30019 RepID=A0A0M3QX31_DROBS|nr:CG11248 [Drosophila busckii]
MLKLQSQNAEQQEQLEQLSLKLKAQQLEQTLKDAQIRDLTSEKKMLMEQLQQTQPTILHLEQQLKDLREKFADTCANLKYSHCKLELEISENYNQQQKLKVLQEQLDVYMQTPKNLSDSSTQTEGQNVVDSSALEQRIKSLELQLQAVKKQKHETVGLLQELLQQQNEKIKNTNEMESDWQQLLDALQATQKLEQNMQLQLQQKADELHQLNELFARQNEQLEQLQELSEAHERRSAEELQELKQVQAQDEANLSQLRHQVALLEESETVTREHHKTLLNLLETETGLNLQHVNSMPQLMKVLRQQLRAAKASEELPTLKSKLAKVSEKHARALDKIKLLEQTLAAERERFEASDAGKSTASIALIEPAHEVANLIDDYKKLIQQTAEETGRPRNSYILELIERSQQCQPNLCQLSEGVAACRADMMSLNRLLVGLNPDTIRQQSVPSLMEELRAVTEHT